MSFVKEFFGVGSRPYPLDHERRRRVLVELALRDMNLSGLARALGIQRSFVSEVVSGRRRSPATERRIADFFELPADELFPPRTVEELRKMRQAEADKRSAA
jgi:transcriptional regulator with XRE-family HTH domain